MARTQTAVILSALIVLLAILPGSAQEETAPFGLRMGIPRSELLVMIGSYKEAQPGFLHVRDLPKNDPNFEAYGLIVSPTKGLCKILAVGKDLPLNGSGDRLKAAFEETARALDGQYGPHDTFDYLKPGSLLRRPDDWTEALAKSQRVLAGSWTPRPGSGLGSVLLETVASNPSVGYLELHFEASDFSACRDELVKDVRTAAR